MYPLGGTRYTFLQSCAQRRCTASAQTRVSASKTFERKSAGSSLKSGGTNGSKSLRALSHTTSNAHQVLRSYTQRNTTGTSTARQCSLLSSSMLLIQSPKSTQRNHLPAGEKLVATYSSSAARGICLPSLSETKSANALTATA